MKRVERSVASALENYLKVERKALERLEAARKKLGDECTHPSDFITVYVWEHDNGYGNQSRRQGLRCKLCQKRKLWKNMGVWE